MVQNFLSTNAVIAAVWLSFSVLVQPTFAMPAMINTSDARARPKNSCHNVRYDLYLLVT